MSFFRFQGRSTAFARAASLHKGLRASLLMALLSWVHSSAVAQHLALAQTIVLPAVQGRLDHIAIDLDGRRLFVAALAAGSVEVLDLHAGARTSRIERLREPQGVSYLAASRRLFIAEGNGQRVVVFADSTQLAVVSGLEDADNLRLEPGGGRLYVGYGSALAAIDARTMRVISRMSLAGHPEAFELAASSPQIFVNVPSAGQIAVVDRSTGKVTATWDIGTAGQNFAMALDERGHRLFVATRRPARLLAFDTASGSRVASITICDDADDLFFDQERRQFYVVCGEGAVDVVQALGADHFKVVEHFQTSPGARTGLFVPQLATLFVAAPARGGLPAEIRAYAVR